MPSIPLQNQLGLCVFVAFLFFGLSPARSQSPGPELQPQLPDPQCSPARRDTDCYIGSLFLKATSYDVALDVCSTARPEPEEPVRKPTCVPDLIQKLVAISKEDRCGANKIDELLLRQKITEMVMTASLQVDGFVAEIDSESNHLREVKDEVIDRQSKSLSRSSLGSNIGTGGGAVGSALGLAARTATAGGWVGAVFGGFGSVFGFVNYFQTLRSPMTCFPANGDNKSCASFVCPSHGNANRGCSPTMLYQIFNQPIEGAKPAADLFHSDYDPVVQHYLEKRGPELIDSWKVSEETKAKLVANHHSPMKLSIEELADRQNKLADLRALVARINRDLSRLTSDLTTGLAQCPVD